MPELKKSDAIFVTGHRGLLGSAICGELRAQGFTNLVTVPRAELDLTQQEPTFAFVKNVKPKAVIHCAALVGGIQANKLRPAEFLAANLAMQYNVIHGSHLADVPNLIFFGSNCMYPTAAPQPIREGQLMKGPMEPSNLAYGSAKVAGVVMTDSYREQYQRRYFSIIPASLYGPGDNFDPLSSHVTPALVLKFHTARRLRLESVELWGTGKPRRELLFAGDAAKGVVLLLENYRATEGTINLGTDDDLSVREIGETIASVVGFEGKITFDLTKPDGNMRKLLDSARAAAYGFKPETSLKEGLRQTVEWLATAENVRGVPRSER